MKELAKKYSEHYVSLEGKAIKHMKCDGCYADIPITTTCFAGCLLPDESHFNYNLHAPIYWYDDYITI